MSDIALPQWYWTRGLHDATILRAEQIDVAAVPGGAYEQNCLQLHLDTRIALFDTSISSIRFYNYKVLSEDTALEGAWWLSDTIRTVGSKYLLEIQLQNGREIQTFAIRFTRCEVERKR